MTFTLNRRTAGSIVRWALVGRVFCAASLDGWALMNSGWIAVLIAFLINLPSVLLIGWMTKLDPVSSPATMMDQACGQWVRRVYCLLLCVFAVYEASVSARLVALSAVYAAFDKMPLLALIGVSIGVGCLACLTGGLGIGGASQLWRMIFYVIFVFVFIQQVNHMHWRWLTPILGPGMDVIMKSVLPFGGMQTIIIAAWLCMSEETGQSQHGGVSYKKTGAFFVLKSMLVAVLMILVLLLVVGMLTPVLPGSPNERDFALDQFLANGLNKNALQFPLMLIWFMSQMLMLSFYLYIGCCMLSQCFPRLKSWICVVLVGACSFVMGFTHVSDRNFIDLVNAWRYPLVTVPMIIFAIIYVVKQRGKQVAQSS